MPSWSFFPSFLFLSITTHTHNQTDDVPLPQLFCLIFFIVFFKKNHQICCCETNILCKKKCLASTIRFFCFYCMEKFVKINIVSVMLSLFSCHPESQSHENHKKSTSASASASASSSPSPNPSQKSSDHHRTPPHINDASPSRIPDAEKTANPVYSCPERITNQASQINSFFGRISNHNIITDPETFDFIVLYALIYFVYLFKKKPFRSDMIYPFYVVCFTIANKFLCDYRYSNKTFSLFSGIQISQFNQIELFVLKKIRYKLFIDRDLLRIFYSDE